MSGMGAKVGSPPSAGVAIVGSERQATSDSERDAWAAILATRVSQSFHTLPGGVDTPLTHGPQTDSSVTALRESVDARAGAGQTLGVGYGGDEGEQRDVTRILGELDGGRLGRVRFSVIRENGAISVVLGVESPEQRALTELEKGALLQSLRQTGLKVASVEITTPDAAGAAFLAQRRSVRGTTQQDSSNAYRQVKDRSKAAKKSALQLIG